MGQKSCPVTRPAGNHVSRRGGPRRERGSTLCPGQRNRLAYIRQWSFYVVSATGKFRARKRDGCHASPNLGEINHFAIFLAEVQQQLKLLRSFFNTAYVSSSFRAGLASVCNLALACSEWRFQARSGRTGFRPRGCCGSLVMHRHIRANG